MSKSFRYTDDNLNKQSVKSKAKQMKQQRQAKKLLRQGVDE